MKDLNKEGKRMLMIIPVILIVVVALSLFNTRTTRESEMKEGMEAAVREHISSGIEEADGYRFQEELETIEFLGLEDVKETRSGEATAQVNIGMINLPDLLEEYLVGMSIHDLLEEDRDYYTREYEALKEIYLDKPPHVFSVDVEFREKDQGQWEIASEEALEVHSANRDIPQFYYWRHQSLSTLFDEEIPFDEEMGNAEKAKELISYYEKKVKAGEFTLDRKEGDGKNHYAIEYPLYDQAVLKQEIESMLLSELHDEDLGEDRSGEGIHKIQEIMQSFFDEKDMEKQEVKEITLEEKGIGFALEASDSGEMEHSSVKLNDYLNFLNKPYEIPGFFIEGYEDFEIRPEEERLIITRINEKEEDEIVLLGDAYTGYQFRWTLRGEDLEEDHEITVNRQDLDHLESHQEERPDFLVEDLNFAWEGALDFEADAVHDWLLTEKEIHFLYEKEEALHYQSFNVESGKEIARKRVEGAPELPNIDRMLGFEMTLNSFNGRIYALIGQNLRITEDQWEGLPKELKNEQSMRVIDLEDDEILLSETPVIEEYTIPEVGSPSRTYLPGFVYDVTADGRYLMILHSFPAMSSWNNFLNFSTAHENEDIEEQNQEVLSQMEDAPLWVYDMKDRELTEIPYGDEIDALVPYDVDGLENGKNMIFTEQEGWLTLDIEQQQVRKTGEGGTYRRTEPGAPGVEQYESGQIFGDNLFFTTVREAAEVGGIPSFHYLWNIEGEELQHVGILGPNQYSNQRYYFNHQTEEIVVNSGEEITEDETGAGRDEQEFVERIYRITFEEEKASKNQGDEPVKSFMDLEGFEVVDVMEFPIGNYQESYDRLSTLGHGHSSHPIKDYAHLGYGVLAGSTLENFSPFNETFHYVYKNSEGEDKIVSIDKANKVLNTDTHIMIINDDRLRGYAIDEFFGALEE
ncbi:hypothetical protein [Isachenkonia alkalipeptolytica]|uniref:Uncharacterized protein n=1 Tax=Isachenkonia alkalipeptolytica TaxID=2565777 RepID=A0AA44BDC5_9CLOT|nr:hypothetical protein [Isachenkonia alkalipeptolytica]NBG87763.1 hypothetical protein [Isachenkonia alkalipeptolytica]